MNAKSIALPAEMPDWGIKLLEIIQGEFRSISMKMTTVQEESSQNKKEVQVLSKKLKVMEKQNKDLVNENTDLKEKLLDIEYRQ